MRKQNVEEWFLFFGSIATAMLFSHLCSLMEAALLSITPSQLAELRQKSAQAGKIALSLKHDIDKPIAVILIINTAAHTVGASVAGGSLQALYGGKYMGVFALIFTLLMVQYTEILPKTLGVRYNIRIMKYAARPLLIASWILSPLIKVTHFINRPFELHHPPQPSTTEEISALAALARSSQVISSRQERIIKRVPHLSDRTARSVMLPRDDISFISDERTLAEALAGTVNDFHTRYPVCSGNDRDRVLGYVNVKELFAVQRSHSAETTVAAILRPISFADPEDTAAELLERFAAQHCHMTIVRNPETGKTLGLVTLEDIVEELLGDLDDEFDSLPRTFYSPKENNWIVGGGVPMAQLVRDTNLDLPLRAEPASVWFGNLLKRRIRVGDVLHHNNAEFVVRRVRRGQVFEFLLKRIVAESEMEK